MGGVAARRRRDRGGFFVYRIGSGMMEAVDFVCACEILQSIGSLFFIYSLYSTYVTLLVYSLFCPYIRAYLSRCDGSGTIVRHLRL